MDKVCFLTLPLMIGMKACLFDKSVSSFRYQRLFWIGSWAYGRRDYKTIGQNPKTKTVTNKKKT